MGDFLFIAETLNFELNAKHTIYGKDAVSDSLQRIVKNEPIFYPKATKPPLKNLLVQQIGECVARS